MISRAKVNSTLFRRSRILNMLTTVPSIFYISYCSVGVFGDFRRIAYEHQITLAVPPDANIFSSAVLLNLWAVTCSFLVSSPLPSILTLLPKLSTKPASDNCSRPTSAPSSNLSNCETFTTSHRFAKLKLLKPRLGNRRNRGIWPPSYSLMADHPALLPAPLCPRPEVFPWPLPMPLPMRLRAFFLPCIEVI